MVIPVSFTVLLLALSSIPVKETLQKVKPAWNALVFIRGQIRNIFHLQIWFSVVQNLLHIPFFGMLSFLWMDFFAKRKVAFKKALAWTLVTVLLLSALEEFYQLFLPGREASLVDVFLNLLGFVAGVVAHRLIWHRPVLPLRRTP